MSTIEIPKQEIATVRFYQAAIEEMIARTICGGTENFFNKIDGWCELEIVKLPEGKVEFVAKIYRLMPEHLRKS